MLKIIYFVVFLEVYFEMPFGSRFDDFDSLLGSLLDTILVTFWGTVFASLFRSPKTGVHRNQGQGSPECPHPGNLVIYRYDPGSRVCGPPPPLGEGSFFPGGCGPGAGAGCGPGARGVF